MTTPPHRHVPLPPDPQLQGFAVMGSELDEVARVMSDPVPLRPVDPKTDRPRRPKHLALAAAVVLLAVASAGAATLASPGRPHGAIRTSTASTTAAPEPASPDPAIVALVHTRLAKTQADCPPPTPSMDQTSTAADGTITKQVWGNPTCAPSYVRTKSLDEPELLPVHSTPDGDDIIGYWSVQVGWITSADVQDPHFDFGVWVASADKALNSGAETNGIIVRGS